MHLTALASELPLAKHNSVHFEYPTNITHQGKLFVYRSFVWDCTDEVIAATYFAEDGAKLTVFNG